MKKFWQDFKKFIAKGNVFDMAVGLIIATAFNKIVSSLVNDILMPLFTWMIGTKNLEDLTLTLRGINGNTLEWHYGLFLQAIVNFLVIAFSLFILVKFVANSQKKLKEFNDKYIEQKIKLTREQRKAFKAKSKAENKKLRDILIEYQMECQKQAIEAENIQIMQENTVAEQVKENIQENTATEQTKQEIQEHGEIGESVQLEQEKAENARTEIELLQEILKELKKQNDNK